MVVNFGRQINLSPMQTSVNDHWHCILSNTRFSGTHWQVTTHDGDIELESGEYVPVGHVWRFDLEKHVILV